MLNVNLPVDWHMSPRFDGLSDTAWRVFTHALMWSMAQQTDGEIPWRYVRALHPDGDKPEAYQELAQRRIWRMTKTGVQLIGWSTELGQSTAEEIEHHREMQRERQRKKRQGEKERLASSATGKPSRPPRGENGQRDAPRDVDEMSTGQISSDQDQASTDATKSAWDDVEVRKPGAA